MNNKIKELEEKLFDVDLEYSITKSPKYKILSQQLNEEINKLLKEDLINNK